MPSVWLRLVTSRFDGPPKGLMADRLPIVPRFSSFNVDDGHIAGILRDSG
jgi:hypothetical protein